jgi:hypothetical protein
VIAGVEGAVGKTVALVTGDRPKTSCDSLPNPAADRIKATALRATAPAGAPRGERSWGAIRRDARHVATEPIYSG